ncbi:MAG: enoyl-CoA hydratase/isomerase family protein [Acidobacteria bacterium]|nr:enoyl-CoA hydratase/isomerase family protein [Acidobacteriota bacterium]
MATEILSRLSRLSIEIEPQVARLTLSNPPVNVIDIPMMDELASAISEIEALSDISILVVSGGGKSFSAGVDVGAHAPGEVAGMLGKFHAVIRSLITTKKVTIARVEGHSLGGGAELAMACDLVYTTNDARWGFPEIQLGCFPPVAVSALSALIGQKRAAELILTGATISGKEAAETGLATEAFEESQSRKAVDRTLEKLRGLSVSTLALTKKAMCAWDGVDFDKGLARAEKIYLEELMRTEDAREGIQAFLERRKPEWKGR